MSVTVAPEALWIDNHVALTQWLQALPTQAVVGVDTEFLRRDTFYPQLALLQLGCEGRYALIDPLAFDIADALRAPIGQGTAITVMHSASEDLEVLTRWLPGGPRTLFDTQIAAAFVGLGLGVSYRALVLQLTGEELDKGETRSDWMQRPLSASQRVYATLDVVHLPVLHEILAQRLDKLGRTHWHAEDCERLKMRAFDRKHQDAQPQLALRGAAEWQISEQAMLRRILLWRERMARQLDRPRAWLLDDATALSLVQQPPMDADQFNQHTRGLRALRSPQRHQLQELIATPVSDDELQATQAIPATPQGERKKALNAMKQVVEHYASQLDLPAGLLCPRKVLEEYVATQSLPDLLRGWRAPILKDKLETLLPI